MIEENQVFWFNTKLKEMYSRLYSRHYFGVKNEKYIDDFNICVVL